jgi:hypothetical protein
MGQTLDQLGMPNHFEGDKAALAPADKYGL